MTLHPRQIVALLGSLLLLTACGASGQQHTVQLLDQRLQTRLEPDIKAGRASVQPLPDGAQVTLLDPTSFSNIADARDNRENDPRASIIEALLDPSLMRLRVADTSTLPDNQRDARVRNVTQYFVANGVGLSVLPSGPLPPPAAPQGVTVTINVQCPDAHASSGYGPAIPTCD